MQPQYKQYRPSQVTEFTYTPREPNGIHLSAHEKRLVEELRQSTEHILHREAYSELLAILRQRFSNLTDNFYLLDWLPEQGEDIYTILVDANQVVEVELSRVDRDANPVSFEVTPLNEYLKSHRVLFKFTRRKIDVVAKLEKMSLGNCDHF